MDKVAALLLTGSVAFLVAAGAGVFPWTVCGVAAALCLAHALAARRAARAGLVPATAIRRVELAFAAALVFLLLTLLPLPSSRLVGERRHRQNERVVAALCELTELGLAAPQTPCFSLTRDRGGTLRALALLLAAFGAGAMAARLSRRGRRLYLLFLVGVGTAVAAGGWLGRGLLPQGSTLWWVIPVPEGRPGPVACFINPNHYAGFLALLAPAAFLIAAREAAARRWWPALGAAAAWGVMSAGVVLSLSRGGGLAWAAGMLAAALMAGRRRRWAVGGIAACGGLVAAALVLAPSRVPVRERWQTLRHPTQTESYKARVTAWGDALRIWWRYPLIGCGANAFRMEHPQVQSVSSRAYRTHPENEYVQLLAEGGVAGVGLAALLVVALTGALRRGGSVMGREGAAADREGEGPPVRAVFLAALAAAATHAAFDFCLHLPLYAVVLASLAGLNLAWEMNPAGGRAEQGRGWWWRAAGGTGLRPAVLAAVLACALLPLAGAMRVVGSVSLRDRGGVPAVTRALVWAPASVFLWCSLGDLAADSGTPESMRFGAQCIGQAAEYSPNDYILWLKVGEARLRGGDRAGARAAYGRARELRSWVPVPEIPED